MYSAAGANREKAHAAAARTSGEPIDAAIDPIADQGPQLDREHPLVLDRQIRDAAPGSEPVGCRKRGGRAGVEAPPARTAAVGVGGVGLKFQAEIEFAEKPPG